MLTKLLLLLAAPLAIVVATPRMATAAVPSQTLYEGVLFSTGGPVSDGTYGLTFAIYATQSGGTAAWQEGPIQIKVVGGRFSLRLGETTPLDGKKLAAMPQQWIGVKVAADPELPRQRLAAVPFALHALSASFGYAAATKPGGAASDLACTACVSVSELKFDGDLDLGGQSLKAKDGTFAGGVAANTVTANTVTANTVNATTFVGDGSKLTGIKTVSGGCTKAGEVVRGIKADGTFDCVSFSGSLPKDGISGISNGVVSNVFLDAFNAPSQNLPIPDNTGIEAVSNVVVPDVGTVRDLQVNVQLVNTDLSKISIKLLPPDDKAKGWLLCDPCGEADVKSLNRTWSVKAPPKSGDINKWVGKSAKGAWTLKVLDSAFCVVQKPGNKDLCDVTKNLDGRIVDWSVKVETLSNKKIHDPDGHLFARIASAKSDALPDGKTIAVDTLSNSPMVVAQAWLYDETKKRWLPAATGVESGASCGECGDGADGSFAPTKSTTIVGKLWKFKDFIIPKGVVVTVTGTKPLEIQATGKVQIAGTLSLAGKPGVDVAAGYNSGVCYAGGVGAAGGGTGGQGCYGQAGKPGAGSGGGKGGFSSGYGSGGGGGGGGYGATGSAGAKGNSGVTAGAGGAAYSGVTTGALLGGSGGGSGGYGSAYNASGAGGGAGGGVVKITAPSIAVTGLVDARGGAGGQQRNNCDGGAGGGGSGGGVWLRSTTVSLVGGQVLATGGAGGDAVAGQSSNGGDGGAGAVGRVRIDSPNPVTGSSSPKFAQGASDDLGVTLHAFELTQPTPGRVFLTNRSGTTHKVRLVVTF